jgi:hypothetical protein
MADAPAAVAAPATETVQPATEAAAPATASAPDVDIIEAAAERLAEGAEAAEQPEAEAKAEPKEGEPAAEQEPAKPSEALAAEDEALFADEALKTAAGVKAAAERARQLRAEITAGQKALANKQRAVDHDFRVLKNREAKFKTTKDQHLSWFSQQRDQAQMLGQHVNVLRTGSPAQVVESLGFLTGKDGLAIYEEIVKNAAGLRKAPDPELEALRAEQRALRDELRREREEARQQQEISQKQAVVEQRKAELIEGAKDATKYPTLSRYAGIRPEAVLTELVSMKRAYKAETGTALPDGEAMLQLDQQLALLLRQEGGGAGNPQPEEGRNPGGKPSQSSPAKRTGSVAGIPPSASTRVAPVRQATEEERRQELTPEFYADLGLM